MTLLDMSFLPILLPPYFREENDRDIYNTALWRGVHVYRKLRRNSCLL